MIHYITDIRNAGEEDLIAPVALEMLHIKSAGETIVSIDPVGSWTHEKLIAVEYPEPVHLALKGCDPLDAYLGDQWVGSTEV